MVFALKHGGNLLLKSRIAVQTGDFVFVFVGHQLEQIARHREAERLLVGGLHSGLGLFVLHRATGDLRPLRLLAEIARSLPQFVSRTDRPITALDGQPLPSGWINERVNTSDWDDNLGGVFYGMTWAEISLLLTACELPSIYVRRDLGQVTVFDQVTAELTDGILTVHNPTPFPARISILSEDAHAAARPLGDAGLGTLPVVAIAPGTVYRISV